MSKNHYAINYVTDLQGPFLGLCEPAPLRRMSILNYFSLSHIPARQVKKVIFRGIIEGFLTDSSVIVRPASVAQLDAHLTGDLEVAGFDSRRGRQHSFVEIDHEIFSMVILSLPLIQ